MTMKRRTPWSVFPRRITCAKRCWQVTCRDASTWTVSNPASVVLEENALRDPADYFDCDPDTELCNDTSVSAPAGKCANSFEDCDDPDYLADLHLARVQMPTEYDNWKESNGWSSLYLTIGVYIKILVVLAVLELRYQHEQQPSLLKPLTEARSPFGIYLVANVLIGVLIAAAGPPFGIMGMAYSMSPLYGGDSTLRANYPFIEDFGTTKGKAIAWFMVSLMALVFWLILFFQNRSLPASMTAA